jgi:hypothetical protein
MLKSPSRRSFRSDAKDGAKEAQRAKDAARATERGKTNLKRKTKSAAKSP